MKILSLSFRLYFLIFVLMLTSLGACSRYSVSINENVVYEPPKVFSDFSIPDKALFECVTSTIAEEGLTRAEQLSRLMCPEGEIESLVGLERFSGIEILGLDNNQVNNILPISALTNLKQVSLKNNRIIDFSPLLTLKQLDLLDATGNTTADCESFSAITYRAKRILLQLPRHC